MAPSHYLNQCWLITCKVLWYSHDGISERLLKIFDMTFKITNLQPHLPGSNELISVVLQGNDLYAEQTQACWLRYWCCAQAWTWKRLLKKICLLKVNIDDDKIKSIWMVIKIKIHACKLECLIDPLYAGPHFHTKRAIFFRYWNSHDKDVESSECLIFIMGIHYLMASLYIRWYLYIKTAPWDFF